MIDVIKGGGGLVKGLDRWRVGWPGEWPGERSGEKAGGDGRAGPPGKGAGQGVR